MDCTEFADDAPLEDAQRMLQLLIAALTDTAMANRVSGGLYRWVDICGVTTKPH